MPRFFLTMQRKTFWPYHNFLAHRRLNFWPCRDFSDHAACFFDHAATYISSGSLYFSNMPRPIFSLIQPIFRTYYEFVLTMPRLNFVHATCYVSTTPRSIFRPCQELTWTWLYRDLFFDQATTYFWITPRFNFCPRPLFSTKQHFFSTMPWFF